MKLALQQGKLGSRLADHLSSPHVDSTISQPIGTCGEGMIRHSIPGWSDDGAPHRMNCDTPPLKGYCQGTLDSRCERFQTSDVREIRVSNQKPVKRSTHVSPNRKM